jgi:hypothetical protein
VIPSHKRLILLLLENRIGAERDLGFASAIANAAALESARDDLLNSLEELEHLRDRVADLGALAD